MSKVVIKKKKIVLNQGRSDRLLKVLRETFKLENFRPKQEQIISGVLDGNDILVLMPTGSGKSLCYQLPAVMGKGISIVISPLIALINDQMAFLRSLGICCYYLNSQTSSKEKNELIKDLRSPIPQCRLLYTTPETLVTNFSLISALDNLHKKGLFSRMVIDEAHCVSNWGHEFRPSYLKLKQVKHTYKGLQIIAFTATATPKVRIDIIKQLNMRRTLMFKQSFVRHNLSYHVQKKTTHSNTIMKMTDLIKNNFQGQSGLIYCLSRQNCEDVSRDLNARGLDTHYFHAGMSANSRKDVQTRWLNNEIRIIVATIAFGLGINKPDVRFVFHYSVPKSIEGYYQETGRAGRDGLASTCVLYYSERDRYALKNIISQNTGGAPTNNTILLETMVNFCRNQIDCRKKLLSVYLGEYREIECSREIACDNCQCFTNIEQKDLTQFWPAIEELFKHQSRMNENNLIQKLTNVVPVDKTDARRLMTQMVIDGFINLRTVMNKSREIVEYYHLPESSGSQTQRLTLDVCTNSRDSSNSSHTDNSIDRDQLWSKLANYRLTKSVTKRCMPYRIFNDRTIDEIVERRPKTRASLLSVYGIGPRKLEEFGDDILTMIIEN